VPSFGKLGCRNSLVLPSLILVPLAFLVIVFLNRYAAQHDATRLVTRMARESTAHLTDRLRNDLEKAHMLVNLNVLAIKAGEINGTTLFKRPEAWFLNRLKAFPTVDDVYLGRHDGAIAGIDHKADHYQLKLTTVFPKRDFIALDALGQRQGVVAQDTYDATSRGWYKQAMTRNGSVWSDVYVLLNRGQIGITAARPAYDPDGRLVGVFGANLTLKTISDYLQAAPISEHSIAYIVEQDGKLIATSTHHDILQAVGPQGKPARQTAAAVGDPRIAESYRRLLQDGRLPDMQASEGIALRIANADYLLYASPFRDERGLDWHVVSVVRLDDFTAEADARAREILIVGLLLTLALTLTVALIGKWVADPIERLSAVARRMASGTAGEQVDIHSGPREVIDLATAFNAMSAGLHSANEELRGIATALETEVTARTAALRESNELLIVERERAEQASAAKSQFLANMSHEIRTPMNGVLGMLYLALRTDMPQAARDQLAKAQTAANALLGIINDILDFSKIEAGKLEIDQTIFSLESVIERVTDTIQPLAKQKGVELLIRYDPEIPTHLLGDPLRLGQILLNLCSNAVKFTEDGEIELRFQIDAREGDDLRLRISVRDTGIGMSGDFRDRLFEKFSQADQSTTRRFGGTGLGLAICRNLTELMGGRIWLERSEPGEGTTIAFTVQLKVLASSTGLTDELAQAGTLLDGVRVLVVDDVAISREILYETLRHFHIQVETAVSGAAALARLEEPDRPPFDVVLVDWYMPAMKGDEVIRRIHANPSISPKPKVLMVTAFGREDVLKDAENAPADGFLIKPVSPSTLLDALLSALGRGRLLSSQQSTRPAVQAEPATPGLQGARVLLVEDNEINREFAIELLKSHCIRVAVAENGRQAIDQVMADDFDLVLMDLQMPVMGGLEATRAIRALAGQPAHARLAHLPIIAMTALAMETDKTQSLEAGMNDHITKPIDPDALVATLGRWLRAAVPDSSAAALPVMPASPPPQSTPIPADLAGLRTIDVTRGIARIGGSADAYRRLLLRFRESQAKAADVLTSLIDANTLHDAQEHCHALKGVAGNLGISSLFDTLNRIDAVLQTNRVPSRADLDAVYKQLGEVMAELDTLDNSPALAHDAAPEADLTTVLRLLDELAEALHTDIGAADAPLTQLIQHSTRVPIGDFKARIDAIAAQLDVFEIDAATDAVNALRTRLRN